MGRSWSFNVPDTRATYPKFDGEKLQGPASSSEGSEGAIKDGVSQKDASSVEEPLQEMPQQESAAAAGGPESTGRSYTVSLYPSLFFS